ncbi:MAG: MFS transporter [Coriobacteriia bacterium]|nr:MFS transporter [Coriobacteriia bacterium]
MKNLTNNYIINNKGTQTFYSHVDFVNYIKSLNGVGSNLSYIVQENNDNKTRLELVDKTTQNVYEIDSSEINSFDLNYNNSSFTICNTDKNQAIFYYYKQDSLLVLDEITYSIPTYIYIISFWLCLAYLIILAIVLTIRYFIRAYKKDLKKFFRVIIGVVIFISVMLTTLYVCAEMYHKEKNDIYNQVQSQSLYFSETSHEIGDMFQNKNWNEDLSGFKSYEKTINNFKNICKDLDLLCIASAKYDIDYIYQVLYYDKQEQGFRVLADSRELVVVGEDDKHFTPEAQQKVLNKEAVSGEDRDVTDKYIYAYAPIYNSQNEVVGCIMIGSYVQSLNSQIGNIYFRLIVLLLLVLIVIYLLTTEILETRKSFFRYRYYKKNKLFFPEINLIASIDYIKNMIFNADCVLCVLVAKEMLVQYGMENDGVLMGLPALMVGVGMLFGPFVFGFVKRFLTIKKIYVVGSITIICTMAIAVFNVVNNMFVMFCVVKLIFGIGYSLIDVGNSTYPLFITNKKFREGIIRRLSLTDIATSVLSVTIAGQLASVFGNQSIYSFITILGILLLLVNMYVLPKNQFFKSNISEGQKKVPLKNIIKLVFSPAIIMSILFMIFIFLINGYKSMLFPVLVSGMNYSQTDISNLFAIGATIALIFNKAYFRFNDRFDVWPAAILNLIIISIIFCIFAINSTLWWSLIAVVLVYLIHRCLASQRQVLWPRQCIKSGIEPSTMQPFFSLVEGVATMLRPLILGVFINVAGNNACFMLGACLFIFTIIYFLITRNTALSERISNW